MVNEKPIKWKNPYKSKASETSIVNINRILLFFHNTYLYRTWTRLTTPYIKSHLELELSKFVFDKPRHSYPARWLFAGMTLGFAIYVWDTKARQINYDLVDPGKFMVYQYKLFSLGREMRFNSWAFLETRAGIMLKNPRSPVANAESFILEPYKKEYLLSLQIAQYEKRRNKRLDFLSIGEQNVFHLI
jgi:hypothetical protein